MVNKLTLQVISECIGTLVFLLVISNVVNKNSFGSNGPFVIGLTLAFVIVAFGSISGGHFNPAVTFMVLLSEGKSRDFSKAFWYVCAQLTGAAAAYGLSQV